MHMNEYKPIKGLHTHDYIIRGFPEFRESKVLGNAEVALLQLRIDRLQLFVNLLAKELIMSQSKTKLVCEYSPLPTQFASPKNKGSLKWSKVTSNKKLLIAGVFFVFLIVLTVCLLLIVKRPSKSPEKKGRCSQQWY